jgi:hypothetical protein
MEDRGWRIEDRRQRIVDLDFKKLSVRHEGAGLEQTIAELTSERNQ